MSPKPGVAPPADLLCPITHKLFNNPVTLVESGHTYDSKAIRGWLSLPGPHRDPLTGQQLQSTQLVPNVAIKHMVDTWLECHPEFKRDATAAPALQHFFAQQREQDQDCSAADPTRHTAPRQPAAAGAIGITQAGTIATTADLAHASAAAAAAPFAAVVAAPATSAKATTAATMATTAADTELALSKCNGGITSSLEKGRSGIISNTSSGSLPLAHHLGSMPLTDLSTDLSYDPELVDLAGTVHSPQFKSTFPVSNSCSNCGQVADKDSAAITPAVGALHNSAAGGSNSTYTPQAQMELQHVPAQPVLHRAAASIASDVTVSESWRRTRSKGPAAAAAAAVAAAAVPEDEPLLHDEYDSVDLSPRHCAVHAPSAAPTHPPAPCAAPTTPPAPSAAASTQTASRLASSSGACAAARGQAAPVNAQAARYSSSSASLNLSPVGNSSPVASTMTAAMVHAAQGAAAGSDGAAGHAARRTSSDAAASSAQQQSVKQLAGAQSAAVKAAATTAAAAHAQEAQQTTENATGRVSPAARIPQSLSYPLQPQQHDEVLLLQRHADALNRLAGAAAAGIASAKLKSGGAAALTPESQQKLQQHKAHDHRTANTKNNTEEAAAAAAAPPTPWQFAGPTVVAAAAQDQQGKHMSSTFVPAAVADTLKAAAAASKRSCSPSTELEPGHWQQQQRQQQQPSGTAGDQPGRSVATMLSAAAAAQRRRSRDSTPAHSPRSPEGRKVQPIPQLAAAFDAVQLNAGKLQQRHQSPMQQRQAAAARAQQLGRELLRQGQQQQQATLAAQAHALASTTTYQAMTAVAARAASSIPLPNPGQTLVNASGAAAVGAGEVSGEQVATGSNTGDSRGAAAVLAGAAGSAKAVAQGDENYGSTSVGSLPSRPGVDGQLGAGSSGCSLSATAHSSATRYEQGTQQLPACPYNQERGTNTSATCTATAQQQQQQQQQQQHAQAYVQVAHHHAAQHPLLQQQQMRAPQHPLAAAAAAGGAGSPGSLAPVYQQNSLDHTSAFYSAGRGLQSLDSKPCSVASIGREASVQQQQQQQQKQWNIAQGMQQAPWQQDTRQLAGQSAMQQQQDAASSGSAAACSTMNSSGVWAASSTLHLQHQQQQQTVRSYGQLPHHQAPPVVVRPGAVLPVLSPLQCAGVSDGTAASIGPHSAHQFPKSDNVRVVNSLQQPIVVNNVPSMQQRFGWQGGPSGASQIKPEGQIITYPVLGGMGVSTQQQLQQHQHQQHQQQGLLEMQEAAAMQCHSRSGSQATAYGQSGYPAVVSYSLPRRQQQQSQQQQRSDNHGSDLQQPSIAADHQQQQQHWKQQQPVLQELSKTPPQYGAATADTTAAANLQPRTAIYRPDYPATQQQPSPTISKQQDVRCNQMPMQAGSSKPEGLALHQAGLAAPPNARPANNNNNNNCSSRPENLGVFALGTDPMHEQLQTAPYARPDCSPDRKTRLAQPSRPGTLPADVAMPDQQPPLQPQLQNVGNNSSNEAAAVEPEIVDLAQGLGAANRGGSPGAVIPEYDTAAAAAAAAAVQGCDQWEGGGSDGLSPEQEARIAAYTAQQRALVIQMQQEWLQHQQQRQRNQQQQEVQRKQWQQQEQDEESVEQRSNTRDDEQLHSRQAVAAAVYHQQHLGGLGHDSLQQQRQQYALGVQHAGAPIPQAAALASPLRPRAHIPAEAAAAVAAAASPYQKPASSPSSSSSAAHDRWRLEQQRLKRQSYESAGVSSAVGSTAAAAAQDNAGANDMHAADQAARAHAHLQNSTPLRQKYSHQVAEDVREQYHVLAIHQPMHQQASCATTTATNFFSASSSSALSASRHSVEEESSRQSYISQQAAVQRQQQYLPPRQHAMVLGGEADSMQDDSSRRSYISQQGPVQRQQQHLLPRQHALDVDADSSRHSYLPLHLQQGPTQPQQYLSLGQYLDDDLYAALEDQHAGHAGVGYTMGVLGIPSADSCGDSAWPPHQLRRMSAAVGRPGSMVHRHGVETDAAAAGSAAAQQQQGMKSGKKKGAWKKMLGAVKYMVAYDPNKC